MKYRRVLPWAIPTILLLIGSYYFYFTHQESRTISRTWYDNNNHNKDIPPIWPDILNISTPSPSLWKGKNATRTLVVAKLQQDDTSWVDELIQNDPHLTGAVYTVDKHNATLTVPANKGHEVMVYLTYIIDHYDRLDDVTMFMHAHQITWHNNDFLDSDSAQMVRRLKNTHVLRNGYMNLRCHQRPGCPAHIHLTGGQTDDEVHFPETAVIGDSWRQIFPNDPVPEALSQACCAQFAVSSERIRRLPRRRYVEYREWLLRTELDDGLSGRVWEYLWQWLFTGRGELCPVETTCYCEGYGICMDPDEYDRYYKNREEARKLETQLEELEGSDETAAELRKKIDDLHGKMEEFKTKAVAE
ncbi:hypothetical protein EYZ11_005177 [Aspergillus tanneri]|uniref:DUF3431 domain-containing protein n=1 Tax=Aspergillus tanneri TaxID=1220188 RepID=A0A4S3JIU1_9EURO|nr:uncharacterized protein ATNIH1004_007193 [Aspergillus tanneri]KAA8645774.1 hypothetical protein ATNIH1004_007193 [Aspergillus tanneri]THC95363.1 hypothetical protein EYZ11_005177 [Aspergillus tanneri]